MVNRLIFIVINNEFSYVSLKIKTLSQAVFESLLFCLFAAHVIAKAKGLAVLSVIKAGFLVTARGGSGIVLARLPDGSKLIFVETLHLPGLASLLVSYRMWPVRMPCVCLLNHVVCVRDSGKAGLRLLPGYYERSVQLFYYGLQAFHRTLS